MKHTKIATKSRAEMERRILLAFGINQTARLLPSELMMAVGVTRRPVDETPGLEAAVAALVQRGVLAIDDRPTGRQAVLLMDAAAVPDDEVEDLRRSMGLEEVEEAPPFSRIMALPVPDPLAFGWSN